MGVRSVITGDARLRRLARKALFAIQPGARKWYNDVENAFQDGRWEDVVELIETSIRKRRWYISPVAYTKLAQSQAHLGAFEPAAKSLAKGARTFPSNLPVAKARAELAMVMQDWDTAAHAWDAFDRLQDPKGTRLAAFPVRGNDFTWFEQTWTELANHWPSGAASSDRSGSWSHGPSARAMVRTIETLRTLDSRDAALALSERMLSVYPESPALVSRVCETIIRLNEYESIEDGASALEKAYPLATVREYAARMRSAASVFDDLRSEERLANDGIRLLSVERGSGLAAAVFVSQPWTHRRIHDEAIRLSRRDHWAEGSSDTDLLTHAAWHQSRRFARGRGDALGIADDDVARAVFHNVKHELILKIPVDRIAEEIARTNQGEPVFVNLSNLKFTYLVAYPWSAFGSIYLYNALRKRGVPVYLVRFPTYPRVGELSEDGMETTGPSLVARSSGSGLRPPNRVWEPVPERTNELVVPSGIRSVATLLEQTGDAVVLNSGAPLKAYAYDRSFRQSWDYEVHRSVHPRWRLPIVETETKTREMWIRQGDEVALTEPVAGAIAEMTLATAPWPDGSWSDLLAQTVMPYFEFMVTRARELMELWGTTDIHIGDYLYAEPSLLAAVAAERGARIHVWPHSANPVHVNLHDHDRITTVRAVTRSGVQVWKNVATTAKVIHDPSLVVRESTENVEWVSDQPISLVLIGGRPIMRDLPILDLEAHEDLYRNLLMALEPLVEAGKLRVYFKPRGLSGENEGWLESVVGSAAGWKPVLGHPLRIDLPNLVYGSVSVASTALIEGVSRGIPGFVVREGAARDYIALEPGSLQIFSLIEAIDWLKSHMDEASWLAWREQQSTWLARELTPDVETSA